MRCLQHIPQGFAGRGKAVRQIPVLRKDRLQPGNAGFVNIDGKGREEFLGHYDYSPFRQKNTPVVQPERGITVFVIIQTDEQTDDCSLMPWVK